MVTTVHSLPAQPRSGIGRRGLLAAAAAAVLVRPARAQPPVPTAPVSTAPVSTAPVSTAPVSTALVLAADVSSSIDERCFDLQRQGYAAALTDERVIRAIRDTTRGAIGVCYFEWAGRDRQHLLVPWTRVADADDGARIAAVLEAAPRPFNGSTGLGPAIAFATSLLAAAPFAAAAQVIDVSGDGPNNDGSDPDRVRDAAVAQGIRFNGLAIRDGYPTFPGVITLPEYYEDNVKGGTGAFVIEADGFESFGATLVAKLRREIA